MPDMDAVRRLFATLGEGHRASFAELRDKVAALPLDDDVPGSSPYAIGFNAGLRDYRDRFLRMMDAILDG